MSLNSDDNRFKAAPRQVVADTSSAPSIESLRSWMLAPRQIVSNSWILLVGLALGLSATISPPIAVVMLFGLIAVLFITVRPYWVVLFLTAFIPFENLVLKFLPVSDQIYFASQFASEMLIYMTFVALVLRKLLDGRAFRRTPIDVPLLAFVGVAILSLIVNRSPLFGSLVNLRALLRYVVLFYLVMNLDLTPKQALWLIRIILVVGLIQLLIAGLQLASGGAWNELLIPRQTEINIAGYSRQFTLIIRGRELGSVFGATGDTVFFGLFMLIVLSVYLGRLKALNLLSISFVVIIFVAIGCAYTRAVVFGMLLMLLIFYRLRCGLKRLLLISFPMVLLGILGLLLVISNPADDFVSPLISKQNIIHNVTGIFSRRYIEIAQRQRLGALTRVVPTILANRPILGYGPDEEGTIERLGKSRPSFLESPNLDKGRFEDVYWVAILAYYGLPGVFLMALLVHKLYSSAYRIYRTSAHELTREISVMVIYIVGLVPFLLFFYRALEFRIYSFYFWLLPALMFGLHVQERALGLNSQD